MLYISKLGCRPRTRLQGSHGHGKSWKILKFETILESHGKVMDFCLFFKKSWKTDISRKSHGQVMEFYTNRQFCARCMVMAVLWIAYFFHYFLSSLLSFTLSRECIYINVCLVMVVAVRAGHLDFSTKVKFMVIDFNFIQSIQLYRPNL